MKAAILEKINGPLAVADVELGELSVGQVLVKVLVSGICGAQLQEIAGNKNNAKFVPHLLGHEGCGIVEDIGAGVTKVKRVTKWSCTGARATVLKPTSPPIHLKERRCGAAK